MENRFSQKFIIVSTLLLLTVVIVSIYMNVLNGEFILDDYTSVVQGTNIESVNPLDHLQLLRPVGNYTFALNHALHEKRVFGYHLVNIIIHIVNSILIFFFVRILFDGKKIEQSSITSKKDITAIFAALLFAVHPIQTQGVSYITQRLESLSTLFFLSAFILYFRSVLSDQEGKKSLRPYIFSVLMFILALLTKESTIMLLLIIPLAELLIFGLSAKRYVKNCMSLLAVGLVILLILVSAFDLSELYGNISGETFIEKLDSITRETDEVSRTEYLITQVNVVRQYISYLLFPVNQNLDHAYPFVYSIKTPKSLFSLGVLLLTLLIGVFFVRKNRLMLFGILFFYITLIPTSSIIPITDAMFEHRLYLPSAGFFLAFVVFYFIISNIIHESGLPKKMSGWSSSFGSLLEIKNKSIVILLIVCNIFAFGAFKRNTVWETEEGMWKDVISKAPDNWRGYANLSEVYRRKGQHDEQARALHNVLIKGAGIEDIDYYAYNLSIYYFTRGEYENALFYFNRTIEIDPDFGEAYLYQGRIYREQKDFLRAISSLKTALEKPFTLRIIPRETVWLQLGLSHYEILAENKTGELYGENDLIAKNKYHRDEAVKYLQQINDQKTIAVNRDMITEFLSHLEKM